MREAPLRIALVYDDSLDRHGGIPQYLTTLAAALGRRGHMVSLAVGQTARTQVAGAPVHSLSRNLGVRFNGNRLSMPVVPRWRQVRQLASAGDFDVVHVQVPYSPLMAGVFIEALPAQTALIGTFHIASERWLPRVGARALAWATAANRRRFDEIVCVSEHARDFARDTFAVRDPEIVPNMIDTRSWRAARSPRSQPARVAYVGALVPRKGPERLIQAFAEVHGALPDARLTVAGEGPLQRRLDRQVRRLGLEGVVELTGRVSEREKMQLLADAHIACFPSRFGESFGIVLLEALAAAGPAVIAGDNAGYAAVLRDVPRSLCAPEPRALAARIISLLKDDGARRSLARAQQPLLQPYEADEVCGRLVAIYRRALRRRLDVLPAPANA